MACPYGYGSSSSPTPETPTNSTVRFELPEEEDPENQVSLFSLKSRKNLKYVQKGTNKVELGLGATYGEYLQVSLIYFYFSKWFLNV